MTYLPYTGIGSRGTPKPILKKMRACSKRLNELGFTLRSGGAVGADEAFECEQSEIYLPYDGFEDKRDNGLHFIAAPFLPNYNEAQEIAAKFHPKWGDLNAQGKLCHTRNVYQVLGHSLDKPSLFVVCWTKDGKASGGTGQAMRIAKACDVPIFNLYFEDALDKLGEWLRGGGYV